MYAYIALFHHVVIYASFYVYEQLRNVTSKITAQEVMNDELVIDVLQRCDITTVLGVSTCIIQLCIVVNEVFILYYSHPLRIL